jgi:hypothetical protein
VNVDKIRKGAEFITFTARKKCIKKPIYIHQFQMYGVPAFFKKSCLFNLYFFVIKENSYG